MKRRRVMVLVAVILGAAIFGRAVQAGEATAPLTKLTFGAPTTPPNLVHITPWVAKEQGFFVEEGLDVEITTFEGGVYVIRNVVSGSLDAGGGAGAAAIVSAAKKAGIKAIYAPPPRSSSPLTVRPKIKPLQAPKGKKSGARKLVGLPTFSAGWCWQRR